MSCFKAKMHQIRFQLGLCPRPRWGSLQRFPRSPIAGFKGLTSKGRKAKDENGEYGKERKERKGRVREGKARK